MAQRKYFRKIYKKRKRLGLILKTTGVLAIFFFIAAAILFIYYLKDLPRPEKFSEGSIAQSTKIYDRTNKILLYEIAGEEKRTLVGLNSIPDSLKNAVISTEDADFYKHKGIDLKALARAMLYDLKLGGFVQGGSTISQQLIRSYFLTRKKTLARKTREIVLTLELERRYSKDQILEWYLNLIPFGGNVYGVESASQTFFGKPVSEISLAESAVLAALIRAPSLLSPYDAEGLKRLLERKNYVLRQMTNNGYITKEQEYQTEKEIIAFSKTQNKIEAPHFVMYVKQYLEEKYGQDFLTKNGLRIQTTLDFNLQKSAEEIVKRGVESAKKYNAHNGGLVAIDPKTGEILVMVGSIASDPKDYFGEPFPEGCNPGVNCLFDPQVNVALSARQPGSAFKPFVYAAAFKKGFTPNTILWDAKTEFNPNCSSAADEEKDKYGQDCYHPKNYDEKYKGPISLRSCLAQSRNIPSVKLLYLAGLSEVLKLAKSFGIQTLTNEKSYGLSLVLGGGEVKLLEITGAYAVFANDGEKAPLNFIKKIEDSQGKIIEEHKPFSIKILSSQIVREINNILSDNEARTPVFGPNSYLYIKDYEVAVKTGTTQRFNDAWAIGYIPSLAVGVWVGNNNNASMTKEGLSLAGPIWREFFLEALKGLPKESFKKPEERITGIPVLDGVLPETNHCILYYIDKANPLEEIKTPSQDPQYQNWEEGARNYLKSL